MRHKIRKKNVIKTSAALSDGYSRKIKSVVDRESIYSQETQIIHQGKLYFQNIKVLSITAVLLQQVATSNTVDPVFSITVASFGSDLIDPQFSELSLVRADIPYGNFGEEMSIKTSAQNREKLTPSLSVYTHHKFRKI